jgi:hypothetical protein
MTQEEFLKGLADCADSGPEGVDGDVDVLEIVSRQHYNPIHLELHQIRRSEIILAHFLNRSLIV